MKIGIDATALPPKPGGAGNYIIQLIRALVALKSGNEFTVFVQGRGQKQIHLPAGHGLKWYTLPDKPPALRLIWEQLIFPSHVRKSGIELLHSTHYTRPFSLSCKSVVTVHDMTFFLYPQLHTLPKRLYFPKAIRMSARRADGLIASSESTRQDALKILKIPAEKITTVHLGVGEDFHVVSETSHRQDLGLLELVRERYKLPPRFFLYVGTVEPRKNLPLLIRSYARLRQENPESGRNLPSGSILPSMPLVVVGQLGWNYDEVFRQVEELQLKEQILFTGYVPSTDLPIIYNLAEIFLYPSLYEGFGLPPLEALACGTPVITTAVSSMPEHVGEAGMLIPPGDEIALVEAMRKLSSEPDLRQHLAELGPQQAAKFTWKRTAQETLEVYQAVCGQPPYKSFVPRDSLGASGTVTD
jgi:glycosyltransferase involved in cell wall biosynthesis